MGGLRRFALQMWTHRFASRGGVCDVHGTKGGASASTTCADQYEIATVCNRQDPCDIDICEANCAGNVNCMFFFSNTRGGCLLYSQCDETRSPSSSGWTRRRAN